ncbi:MAG: LysM peptidoglycan-binding domain-containing protein [Solirubrobacteraceae bacterium]|nr:LysM peptidoglycan-binding domain-containing protein [Patulibacter sp.]
MSRPPASTHRLARRLLATAVAACLVGPAAAQAYPIHTVRSGETLSSIAAANGMQIARLAAANGMPWNGQVVVGQALQVPPRDGLYTSTTGQTMGTATSSSAARAASSGTSSGTASTPAVRQSVSSTVRSGSGAYVRPGDTLSAIAARLGVSMAALAAANGISSYDLIYSGTTLRSPAPGTTATPAPSAVPVTASTGPEGAAAAQGVGAHPTTLRLTSAQVAQVAAQNGVPGNLAAAIAWQESGNNNAMVSAAGARGIMQVMPGTWDWINSALARPPLSRTSAVDNVRAGSLLLKQLLAQTGGDTNTAIAGYYQGLNSVRTRGLYDDTKQYVANVNAIRARLGG